MDARDYIALNKSILDDEISDEMRDRIELRKELTQLRAENDRLKAEIFDIKLSFYVLSLLVVVITIWWLVEITNP
jgi:SMC interacting uncharacterized protein involved in chromosome segregation